MCENDTHLTQPIMIFFIFYRRFGLKRDIVTPEFRTIILGEDIRINLGDYTEDLFGGIREG